MRIAICPGSFDPVTLGHMDIIRRASNLFDKVIVVVMTNSSKKPLFDQVERMELLNRAVAQEGLRNIVVDCYDGLLADYVKLRGATVVVKGLRAMSDFEYEFQMALTNRKLNPQAETVFLTTTAEHMYLSSSLVKQVAHYGGDVSDLVPSCILPDIISKYRKDNEDEHEH
ncbi:MAG: pantetheine-phosphate adenylyltransferase [Ruminococcaceae bacterium]|nr:pantetheine-phosphate adenylyltransferase [Oscillospiraceae bacterium]